MKVFSLCNGLSKEELSKAPRLNDIKHNLIKFLEDKTIVCRNASFEKSFFSYYIPEIKNKIIDSMELATILEPYHKEYNLDYCSLIIILILKRAVSEDHHFNFPVACNN